MKLPKLWTTVTPLSKIIAVAMLVLLPFGGFYLGNKYQKNLNEAGGYTNKGYITENETKGSKKLLEAIPTLENEKIYNLMKFARDEAGMVGEIGKVNKGDTFDMLLWWNSQNLNSYTLWGDYKIYMAEKDLGWVDKLEKLLVNNGFKKNMLNSAVHSIGGQWVVENRAYNKGNIYCLIHLVNDFFMNERLNEQSFTCGEDTGFVEEFNLDRDDPNLYFNVDKLRGDFARVTVVTFDGDTMIAVKQNNKWQVITSVGQAAPLCADLDKYQVPADFYRDCIDLSGTRKGEYE